MRPSVSLLTRRGLSLLLPSHVPGCTHLTWSVGRSCHVCACSRSHKSTRDPLEIALGCLSGRTSRLCATSVRTCAGKGDLLKGVNPQHKDEVARVVEQAERAGSMWTTLFTDFYTPPVVADAMTVIWQLAGVSAFPHGGYAQAERARIVVGQEEVIEALKADPQQAGGVAVVRVQGNFIFDPATHRDFLGAILGTGVERSKVGDIIIMGETGAQILVAEELIEHFEMNLTQVRTVPVSTRQMALSELRVQPAKTEQVRSVEASLRLDAVASAGFRISRAKAADLIKAGDVRVNWAQAKGSSLIKAGDVISCSGKGRVEVISSSLTKKGRHAVEMMRYL